MTDLPTLEAAMKLADQDSPLPSLAGPALKVLRDHIQKRNGEEDHLTQLAREFGTVKWFERHGVPEPTKDSATLTALIAELRAREGVGRAKYGTDVDRTDLTNAQWRQHLREELMDALLYSLAEERTQPAEVAECWCETCRPVAFVDLRMVLCPTCGNKRCPHAHDHRNACTHSNAVGQPGSSWEHIKPSATVSLWRHIDWAPTDGTPVLVKVKPVAALPDRAAMWGGHVFVARNKSDASEWCFAAPVGCGDFLDAWLEGWMPLPAPEDC
jgi:hypothetical protein